jgi:hypothetical protein
MAICLNARTARDGLRKPRDVFVHHYADQFGLRVVLIDEIAHALGKSLDARRR